LIWILDGPYNVSRQALYRSQPQFQPQSSPSGVCYHPYLVMMSVSVIVSVIVSVSVSVRNLVGTVIGDVDGICVRRCRQL
jgi:hypothetical protein